MNIKASGFCGLKPKCIAWKLLLDLLVTSVLQP